MRSMCCGLPKNAAPAHMTAIWSLWNAHLAPALFTLRIQNNNPEPNHCRLASRADMNAYRADRCCRTSCTRIADGMRLRPYVITHSSYQDVRGGRRAADSMVAETLEVPLRIRDRVTVRVRARVRGHG